MNSKKINDKIIRFAHRVSETPFFLGYSLKKFQIINKMTDDELSEFLKCKKMSLIKLATCRNPVASDKNFFNDVNQIAQYVACDTNQLGKLIRQINSIHSLEYRSDDDYTLLAACDSDKSEPLEHDEDSQGQDKNE